MTEVKLDLEVAGPEAQAKNIEQFLQNLRTRYSSEDGWNVDREGDSVTVYRGWKDGFRIGFSTGGSNSSRAQVSLTPASKWWKAWQVVGKVVLGLAVGPGIIGFIVGFANLFFHWLPEVNLGLVKTNALVNISIWGILGLLVGLVIVCIFALFAWMLGLVPRDLDEAQVQPVVEMVRKAFEPNTDNRGIQDT